MSECNEQLALAAAIADSIAEGKTIPQLCYINSILDLVKSNINTIIHKRHCIAERERLLAAEKELLLKELEKDASRGEK